MKKPDEETKKKPEKSRIDKIREAWYAAHQRRDGYADEHEPEEDDDDELYNAWNVVLNNKGGQYEQWPVFH